MFKANSNLKAETKVKKIIDTTYREFDSLIKLHKLDIKVSYISNLLEYTLYGSEEGKLTSKKSDGRLSREELKHVTTILHEAGAYMSNQKLNEKEGFILLKYLQRYIPD